MNNVQKAASALVAAGVGEWAKPSPASDGYVSWPTEAGIWMGNIGKSWFPLRVKLLKEYPEGEAHLPMPLVAQYPQSETNWPYTFEGCHPVKEWRKPTEEELAKAIVFYRIDT